jgi:hypothetical protein
LLPGCEVIAYDTDWWARRATREMARASGAGVDVRGFCGPDELRRMLVPGTLVLSDCEGYEDELLARQPAEAFAGVTALIEVHDHIVPGVSGRLRERFGPTHRIEVVGSATRDEAAFDLGFLPPDQRRLAVSEIRPPQEWMLLTPVAQGGQPPARSEGRP